jgi:hypothetical protein
VPEDGKLRIDIYGELAGILAVAANTNRPGSFPTDGLSEQIKEVAGARNLLNLLLTARGIGRSDKAFPERHLGASRQKPTHSGSVESEV